MRRCEGAKVRRCEGAKAKNNRSLSISGNVSSAVGSQIKSFMKYEVTNSRSLGVIEPVCNMCRVTFAIIKELHYSTKKREHFPAFSCYSEVL